MKNVLMVIAMSVFLVAGLLATPHVFAQATNQTVAATTETTSGATMPAPVKQRGERRERHPQIHKALRKLRAAKQDLEKAASDYGGHKAAAIQAINQAIGDLEAALHSDKK